MKILRTGMFAAALALAMAANAQVKISDLPAGTTLGGTEAIPAVQSANTVRTTPAAIDTYVKTAGATLGVAKGGTNLTAASDDNVMVGNGTTWQAKAVPDCQTTAGALSYTQSSNSFNCNTTVSAQTGTFTANFSAGWTTAQTQTFSWTKTGNIVVLQSTSSISATSNATSAISDLSQLPAAITPVANTTVTLQVAASDNGTPKLSCGAVRTNGSIAYGIPDAGGACAFSGWTASGTKIISGGTSGSGVGVWVYKTN